MLFDCCAFFVFKQKTAYEMRISDWSSDVCSSDLCARAAVPAAILALLMLARGSAFALRPGALWPVAGIALGQLGITIGYLSAVAYIPVSLAALVFYAYPVLVAGLLPLTARGGVGRATAAPRSEERRVGKECVSAWR